MPKLYILLALPASILLGCGSYDEVRSFLAKKCGSDYYDIEEQFCQNSQIYDKCGGFSYDPSNQKCENNSLFSKCENEWYNPFSQSCINNIVENKEEFTDSRDNKTYKYVTIGTQIWMAENLRYETTNTKCYDNNPNNCKIYGILYDWNTAENACPLGWHLPNDTEWFTLISFAGNDDAKLMANHVFWLSGKGTDEFGFTALPGGYYRHEGYFLNIEEEAVFWSADEGHIAGSAHVYHISPLSWVREVDGLYINNSWVNVRCVKN